MHKLSFDIGGKSIVVESGLIAKQANGAVTLKCGDIFILSTVCCSQEETENDFFPLVVDYQEKFSSIGKTLGGFTKRESRHAEREILICRLIDRSIRPLFTEGFYSSVQILNYLLSFDHSSPPDALAICAASAALSISNIPFKEPLGAIKIIYKNGKFTLNPSTKEQKDSSLNLLVAGTSSSIVMIESNGNFVDSNIVMEAIEICHKEIKAICAHIKRWSEEIGRPKIEIPLALPIKEKEEEIFAQIEKSKDLLFIPDKKERGASLSDLEKEILSKIPSEDHIRSKLAIKRSLKKVYSHEVISTGTRSDKRRLDEVRPISFTPGLLPRAHGSSLFTRGETQTISVCTLGGETMGQSYEDIIDTKGTKRFYLQYSFPPFSVGEVGRVGIPNRREIGHGKLAEVALKYIIPSKESFPYTIRLESNITESNGSSSMASICGCCLAMIDAGVPIKRRIAGIAMGLLSNDKEDIILSDIMDLEDYLGNMDMKVSGDGKSIAAIQMDVKNNGLEIDLIKRSIEQAMSGCLHILEQMSSFKPEVTLSKHAPRISLLQVNPSKIGLIIGVGGKTINSIIESTGVDIKVNDDGVVHLCANDVESLNNAKAIIEDLCIEITVGNIYKGKITSIKEFGVFIELGGGKSGLCHISQLSNDRINDIRSLFKIGDRLEVKVTAITPKGIQLSRKEIIRTS